MAITEQSRIEGVTKYTPGSTAFTATDNMCVESGDRVIVTRFAFVESGGGNVLGPDANGLYPHLVYRPKYSRRQDPNEARDANLDQSLGGNDAATPTFRVDFGPLYCRWPGTVTIEGGAGASPGDLGSPLYICLAWDRSIRGRLLWWEKIAEVFRRGMSLSRDRHRIDMPTIPVTNGGFVSHILTFYNCPRATRIERPMGASKVWTTNAQTITLDNGAGTTSASVPSSFGLPATMGAFRYMQPGLDNSVVQFQIDL